MSKTDKKAFRLRPKHLFWTIVLGSTAAIAVLAAGIYSTSKYNPNRQETADTPPAEAEMEVWSPNGGKIEGSVFAVQSSFTPADTQNEADEADALIEEPVIRPARTKKQVQETAVQAEEDIVETDVSDVPEEPVRPVKKKTKAVKETETGENEAAQQTDKPAKSTKNSESEKTKTNKNKEKTKDKTPTEPKEKNEPKPEKKTESRPKKQTQPKQHKEVLDNLF